LGLAGHRGSLATTRAIQTVFQDLNAVDNPLLAENFNGGVDEILAGYPLGLAFALNVSDAAVEVVARHVERHGEGACSEQKCCGARKKQVGVK
jgi:hypothetical protein